MCHPVVVKVRGGGETFTTGLTDVWLLSGVDPSVRVQTATGGKPFLAEITHVGPLSRMDPHMSL